MRDKTFDQFIQNKLRDHASPVPEGMWERIAREKERKRRFGWFFPLSVLLVASGVVALSIWIASPSVRSTGGTPSEISSHPMASPVDGQTNKASAIPGQSIVKQNESGSVAAVTPSASAAITTGSVVGETPGLGINTRPQSTFKAVIGQSSRPGQLLMENIQPGKTTNDLTAVASSPEMAYPSLIRYPIQPAPELLPRSSGSGELLNRTKLPAAPPRWKVECPSTGEAQAGDWFVEVFGSPDMARKNVAANKGGSNTFLLRKDSSESPLFSWTLGVRFTKELGENMVFRTGLQYSRINERFFNRSENERKLTTVITTRTITGSQGQTIVIRDTSVTEQIGYAEKTSYNSYSSIDLPLLLGYEFSLENWKLGITGGAILNLRSWQQGETLDTTFVPTSFAKNRTTMYKRNTGIGLYGGLSITRKLTDRTSVFAEPYIRYNLSSLTNSTSLVSEKFRLTGVLLGVRYNLSNRKATH